MRSKGALIAIGLVVLLMYVSIYAYFNELFQALGIH